VCRDSVGTEEHERVKNDCFIFVMIIKYISKQSAYHVFGKSKDFSYILTQTATFSSKKYS